MATYETKRNAELYDGLVRHQTSGDNQKFEDAKEQRIQRLMIDDLAGGFQGSPEQLRLRAEAEWLRIYSTAQQQPFIKEREHLDLEEKNRNWIIESSDKLLLDLLVVPNVGSPCSWPKFRCGSDKQPYDGAKLLRDLFLRRHFALDSKEELLDTIKKELLQPNASYFVNCQKCFGQSVPFRFISKGELK